MPVVGGAKTITLGIIALFLVGCGAENGAMGGGNEGYRAIADAVAAKTTKCGEVVRFGLQFDDPGWRNDLPTLLAYEISNLKYSVGESVATATDKLNDIAFKAEVTFDPGSAARQYNGENARVYGADRGWTEWVPAVEETRKYAKYWIVQKNGKWSIDATPASSLGSFGSVVRGLLQGNSDDRWQAVEVDCGPTPAVVQPLGAQAGAPAADVQPTATPAAVNPTSAEAVSGSSDMPWAPGTREWCLQTLNGADKSTPEWKSLEDKCIPVWLDLMGEPSDPQLSRGSTDWCLRAVRGSIPLSPAEWKSLPPSCNGVTGKLALKIGDLPRPGSSSKARVERYSPPVPVTVVGSGVRIRAQPFSNAETEILAGAPEGLVLSVVGRSQQADGVWYQIRMPDGRLAFVRSDLTSAKL